jgi:hypothetical protein
MAFHPFRSFRKHQKAWLAAVTILAMVTFIMTGSGLATGTGDAFGWIAEMFGGKSQNPTVVKLYGKKVKAQDIEQLRAQRMLANVFMFTVTHRAVGTIYKEINDSKESFGDLKFQVEQALQPFQLYLQFPQFINFFSFQDHQRVGILAAKARLEASGKSQQARLLGDLLQAGEALNRERTRDNDQSGFYFGGSPGLNDLLDFMVWRRQADRLGIQLTEENVKQEIADETLNRLHDDDIQLFLASYRGGRTRATVKQLYAALADELRVRRAQAALLGYEPGSQGLRAVKKEETNDVPSGPTPEEFWEYYKENCVPVKVALLPLPVKDFVDKDQKPSDKELADLFNKYKEKEPTPESDKPGFKQPRRVMVEWISAQPGSEFYKKSSQLAATVIQGLQPGIFDLWVLDDYKRQVRGSGTILDQGAYPQAALISSGFALPYYTHRLHPDQVANMVTGAASINLGQQPLGILANFYQSAVSHEADAQKGAVLAETKARIGVGGTLILDAGAMLPLGVAGSVYAAGEAKRDLPLEAVKADIVNRFRQRLAEEQIANNMAAFSKELKNKRGDLKEAAEYVTKAIKDYGFAPHGVTEKPRDRFDLADDKGVAELRKAYKATRFGPDSTSDAKGEQFASTFFKTSGTYDPQEDFRFTAEGSSYIYWRTEDKPAYIPKLDEVKDKVADAWRFIQARTRARKAAEEIEAKARAAGIEAQKVLDEIAFKNPERGKVITLENVARLLPQPNVQAGPTTYDSFKVPEDQIPYPRADLVKQLSALREPGDSIVVTDRPEKTYYVATLLRRAEPVPEEFHRIYGRTPFNDKLFQRLESERRKQYRLAAIKQLRAESGSVDAYGHFKLECDEDVRRTLDSNRGGPSE